MRRSSDTMRETNRLHNDRIDAAFDAVKQAHRQNAAAVKQLLATPCRYQPGSPDKIAVMMSRKVCGLPVFITGDKDCHITPPNHRGELMHAEAAELMGKGDWL